MIIELTDVVQHRRSSERHPNINSEQESSNPLVQGSHTMRGASDDDSSQKLQSDSFFMRTQQVRKSMPNDTMKVRPSHKAAVRLY